MFHLGSGAIAWSSKKQDVTALSSTEAEYITASSATCQALWMQKLLEDMNERQSESTVIYCDNKLAIAIAKNPTLHVRTKHIDTRFYFIRGLISEGVIKLVYCGTNE